jgi:septal ring factor EnvC (AmiA/AmiB activator)
MLKFDRIKKLIVASLAIALVFASISIGTVNGLADPFSEVKNKLSGISEEEKKILQNLFTLAQELELMEVEERELAQEIKAINQEIRRLEAEIADEETAYEKRRESLKRVLQSYQRM